MEKSEIDVDQLFADALVWDSHAGLFPAPDAPLGGFDVWRAAGVDYVSINVGFDVMDWTDTLKTLVAYRARLLNMPERFRIVGAVDEIAAAKRDGRLAVSFDIEGANALNGDPAMVSAFYDLGVRQMLLAYNLGNAAAGGCHDADIGLSALGREIVAEMNRVGMIVDCSHASRRASLDMCEASTAPAVFTHSNPSAVWPHGRNIDDDQIRACAGTGGVVGVNGMGIFLGENDVSVDTVADHACYIADLVGPDHVGVGLDYKPASAGAGLLGDMLRARPDYWPTSEGYGTPNIRLFDVALLPALCRALRTRGWSKEDLGGFLGGNFARVASATWRRPGGDLTATWRRPDHDQAATLR